MFFRCLGKLGKVLICVFLFCYVQRVDLVQHTVQSIAIMFILMSFLCKMFSDIAFLIVFFSYLRGLEEFLPSRHFGFAYLFYSFVSVPKVDACSLS